MDIQVSAEEMIDELMKKVSQFSMEIVAKDIIIRKLSENITVLEEKLNGQG